MPEVASRFRRERHLAVPLTGRNPAACRCATIIVGFSRLNVIAKPKSCQSLISLSSHRQALREKTRKSSPQDLVLRQFQIIGDEPKPDRKRGAIVNDVTGFRPQVARLPDGTHIDQGSYGKGKQNVAGRRHHPNDLSLSCPDRRFVRVTAEAKRLLLKEEMLLRVQRTQDVLPRFLVVKGRVDRAKVVEIQSQGAIAKPILLRVAELIARKSDSCTRILVEGYLCARLDAGLIVIAEDHGAAQPANQFETLGGVRAITDNIPKADHFLHPLRSNVGQHGFQCLQIAVDVREDGEFHGMHY